jgi:hypothetical protein
VSEEHDLGADGGSYDIPPESAESGAVKTSKFKLVSIAELLLMNFPLWLVFRVIRIGEIVVLYGESACGKTFVVLDLVLKIAAGLEWWGYKTRRGAVVYLAGEGAGGLGRRIQAWETLFPEKLDVLKEPVRILPQSLAFMNEAEFAELLRVLSAEAQKPLVIVVDTLARYMIFGDENSAKDMGVFIARCATLRDATGAAIIIIHHKGKNANTERGSSALRGAADVMIEVTREGEQVVLRGDKSKDAEPLRRIYLKFRTVWLGHDEDGEVLTSLVLDRGAQPADEADEDRAKKDPGRAIRETLAHVLRLSTAGTPLLNASGLAKSVFYRALKLEIAAKRIEAIPGKRWPTYWLTPAAPEYPSPSPSPTDSGTATGTEHREVPQSQSQSHSPPLGGDKGRNWDSNSHQSSSPQQAKQPETAVEPGTAIRAALVTLFRGSAAAGALLRASGLKPNAFYVALAGEVAAHRIETVAKGPATNYRLTPDAPEYVTPSAPAPQQKKPAKRKRVRRARKSPKAEGAP